MTNTITNTNTRYTVIALIDGLWAKMFTTTSLDAAWDYEDELESTFTDIITTNDNDNAVYRVLVTLNGGDILED